ncbi:hypothetical protein E3N88_04485 [Mikania micrantha]|uniref:Uncharacterized protein n=1 Tax=Mikania micrantha TaxID=192012 RepID=A0A5N6PVW5_9ASTR|nr:hypothetical protein E3N88_04485 [Mikania micrantha]
MSEDHRDIQTPKNSSNRKAKPINNPMKKLNQHKQKSIKRNLSAGFTPITEDDVASNPSDKELIKKISSISASVDVHQSTVEISKANLNSVQEDLLQYPEQSIEISSVLEDYVSNEDRFTESMKSYIVSAKQLSSLSAAATSLVELTPSSSSSSLITAEDAAAFINSDKI